MKYGAIVLVVLLGVLSGCQAVTAPLPDSFVCSHCACAAAGRTASAPILCDTLGRETSCCYPIFLGS